MTKEREQEIRDMVLGTWRREMREALGGSEAVMKEVFEQIKNDEEDAVLADELEYLITLLGERQKNLSKV
jgi:hypothetical protein